MPKLIHSRDQVSVRVVYAGPGLGGKTTNLRQIHRYFPESPLTEIASPGDRTVGGDFLPLGADPIAGWTVRLQLATVPGQIQYAGTREMLLRGTDVVVFVADSQAMRRDANLYALDDLRRAFTLDGVELESVPAVFQYNKRDLPGEMELERMDTELNPCGAPAVAAVAHSGVGVLRTLDEAVTLARLEAERFVSPGVIVARR